MNLHKGPKNPSRSLFAQSILHIIVHFRILSSFEIDLPLIEVQQTRSFREVPSIDITFANGVKDSMVLERFYPTQESRMARTPSCNFIGHLENEKTACVSLTGCASSDDLHFTINSKNSGSSNMYILHKDGHLEMVERTFKVRSFFYYFQKILWCFVTKALLINLFF